MYNLIGTYTHKDYRKMARSGEIHGDFTSRTSEDGSETNSWRDPIHIGEQEAWWILEQETAPYHFPNGSWDLRHQII